MCLSGVLVPRRVPHPGSAGAWPDSRGVRVECAVTSAASTTRCPASRDVDPRARTGWSTVGHNAASRRVHHAAVTRHGRQGGSNSAGGRRPDVVSPGNRGCWWSQRKQGVASPTGSLCLLVTEGSAGRSPRRPHPPKRPDPLPSSCDGAASLLPEHRKGVGRECTGRCLLPATVQVRAHYPRGLPE
jgi:hypothetical protein